MFWPELVQVVGEIVIFGSVLESVKGVAKTVAVLGNAFPSASSVIAENVAVFCTPGRNLVPVAKVKIGLDILATVGLMVTVAEKAWPTVTVAVEVPCPSNKPCESYSDMAIVALPTGAKIGIAQTRDPLAGWQRTEFGPTSADMLGKLFTTIAAEVVLGETNFGRRRALDADFRPGIVIEIVPFEVGRSVVFRIAGRAPFGGFDPEQPASAAMPTASVM